MMSTGKLSSQMRAVAGARTEDFGSLIKSSGLDPTCHLRFADWSGVDFSNSDLRGFDFTGSRLIDCIFSGAQISKARFDQAEIDQARPFKILSPTRTNLRLAKDWQAYMEGWAISADILPDGHLPVGAVFQDAPYAPEMVVVPQGQFIMGSSPEELQHHAATADREHQHEVKIPLPFAVGRFPVTFGEFFMSLARGRQADLSGPNASRPVVEVSWGMATSYAGWLSEETGKPYRLLSEAEWEYCCRAGTRSVFNIGDRIARDQACFDAKGLNTIGTYAGNAWGLHDFHGGVWEWCQDDWHDTYDNAPDDGSAWNTRAGIRRKVVRGGCWQSQSSDVRSAVRCPNHVDTKNEIVGFRLARDLVD